MQTDKMASKRFILFLLEMTVCPPRPTYTIRQSKEQTGWIRNMTAVG